MITFTLYPNATSTMGIPMSLSWPDWVKEFAQHKQRGSPSDTNSKELLNKAKDGPCFVAGSIPEGLTRRNKNVTEIAALTIDLEGLSPDEFQEVFTAITPFDYVAYSTHKSGADLVNNQLRLRVILPLDKPITPAQHKEAWAALNLLIGEHNDPQTKDTARLNYAPTTFDLTNKAVTAWHNDTGRRLTLEDLPLPDATPDAHLYDEMATAAQVEKVRQKLKYIPKISPDKIPAQLLIAGQPFAEEGERHKKTVALTWRIARADPNLNEDALHMLFDDSIKDFGDYDFENEVLGSYDTAVMKLAVDTTVDPIEKYATDELKTIALAAKTTPEELKDRWIIQHETNFFFLDDKGHYSPRINKDNFDVAAKKVLARAPVDLTYISENGIRNRSFRDITIQYATIAYNSVCDMFTPYSYFDPETDTLHEAVCQRQRNLTPTQNKGVQGWFDILSPDQTLTNWVSVCPDLSEALCGIHIKGLKNSGKTLLPMGLSRIWNPAGPSLGGVLTSRFQEDLFENPLIMVDEGFDDEQLTRKSVTRRVRELLTKDRRSIEIKYSRKKTPLLGNVRLIISSNADQIFNPEDAKTREDIEAIAERILIIDGGSDSVNYLAKFSVAELKQWGNKAIAEHALWLNENHVIADENKGRRMIVEGNLADSHKHLATGRAGLELQWLAGYCLAPQKYHKLAASGKGSGRVQIINGRLLVQPSALFEHWDIYLEDMRRPKLSDISAALWSISRWGKSEKYKGRAKWQNVMRDYNEIDLKIFKSWCDEMLIPWDEILISLGINTDDPFGKNKDMHTVNDQAF